MTEHSRLDEREHSRLDEPEHARSVLQNLLEVVTVQVENLHHALQKLWDSQWVETGREWIREAIDGIRRRRKRHD